MATEYFKKLVNDEVVIVEYDTETLQSRMYRRKELVSDKKNAEARLAEVGKAPTNQEILAWAKAHYPYMDRGPEVAALTEQIARIEAILEGAK